MLIENRAGAGGVIGTEAASRAAPDGSTLALISSDLLVLPPLGKFFKSRSRSSGAQPRLK
jgi:tripartite-type tricarboxylate transporter receptor subunit TctC